MRAFGVLIINLFWGVIKKFVRFDFLFVVYPGNEHHLKAYKSMELLKFLKGPLKISLIKYRKYWGLTVALPVLPNALWEMEPKDLEDKTGPIIQLADELRVKRIGLAGVLPSLFSAKNVLDKDQRFVVGTKGTLYTTISTMVALEKKKGLDLKKSVFAIVGVGRMGAAFIKTYRSRYKKILAVDRVADRAFAVKSKGVVPIPLEKIELLKEADVILLYTSKGESVKSVARYLKKGAVVVDDTHPEIPNAIVEEIRKGGTSVYKITITANGFKMFPRLFGWNSSWVPGCLLETIVLVGKGGGVVKKSQSNFDKAADSLGFSKIVPQHLLER